MAWLRSARVAETSATAGTGSIALAGAYDGSYRRFNAVAAIGDQFSYVIVGADGTWERGVGTYTAANTLARTVRESSNANALVNFASALTVFLDAPNVEDIASTVATATLAQTQAAAISF